MSVPNYATDLTDIDLAELVGDYVAVGGGGAGLAADPDFAIQGINSICKQVSKARKGILFNNNSGITIPAGDHIFVWIYCTTPGLLDTLAVGGMCVSIGNGDSARNEFHIVGAIEYAQGGWLCVPIKYVTTSSGSHPYRTLVGSPSGNPQYFGVVTDIPDMVKAVNTSVDAMRYGTGAYITAGEQANPATFGGFAILNDAVNARWGILTAIAGGFALQGRFVIGQDNGKVPIAAYFEDGNTLVVLVDTFHSEGDFTQIIIDHASTIFNLTNVTLLALGTINPGKLVFNNASTISALMGCVFDSMGDFILRVGVTATKCTWRSCKSITQNGATLDGCIISDAKTADGEAFIISDNPANIKNGKFTFSDGHAIEITTTTGSPFAFQANKFEGYGGTPGSNLTPESGSLDAAIYNNSGGAITLELTGDCDIPSVRNGVGATTVISAVVALTLKGIPDNTEVTIVKVSDRTVLYHVENTSGDVVYNYGSDEIGLEVDILMVHLDYDPNLGQIFDYTLGSEDVAIPISLVPDPTYYNP